MARIAPARSPAGRSAAASCAFRGGSKRSRIRTTSAGPRRPVPDDRFRTRSPSGLQPTRRSGWRRRRKVRPSLLSFSRRRRFLPELRRQVLRQVVAQIDDDPVAEVGALLYGRDEIELVTILMKQQVPLFAGLALSSRAGLLADSHICSSRKTVRDRGTDRGWSSCG